ncbi:MAG TPA: YceI family protein [Candidatus Dormibacteraeota bacterium]|nr:YceI family protein [Candidatus Dormibacteraeota bacterium]
MPHLNPRLLAAGVGGAAVLAAAGFGIVYLVVFAGSSPQKLALSSATATPSTTASSSATAAGPGTWTVSSGSQAGYRVREQLASLPAPSDAVGRTSSVHGSVTIAASGSSDSVSAASITVDVNTLTSDGAQRDQRIHRMGLESDRYPTATFVLSTPIALPADAAAGQVVNVSATGALTIHGVTKTVTIPIQARLTGSQLELAGSIIFPFSQFGMMPPSIGGFVTVQDNATMESISN